WTSSLGRWPARSPLMEPRTFRSGETYIPDLEVRDCNLLPTGSPRVCAGPSLAPRRRSEHLLGPDRLWPLPRRGPPPRAAMPDTTPGSDLLLPRQQRASPGPKSSLVD